jgi:hypothetical protein
LPPTLWYSEKAIAQIQQYLGSIEEDFVAVLAGEEIRRELTKVAEDPRTPRRAPSHGPFERFARHQFVIDCGGRRRLAQVSYEFSHDGQRFDVLAFSSVPI